VRTRSAQQLCTFDAEAAPQPHFLALKEPEAIAGAFNDSGPHSRFAHHLFLNVLISLHQIGTSSPENFRRGCRSQGSGSHCTGSRRQRPPLPLCPPPVSGRERTDTSAPDLTSRSGNLCRGCRATGLLRSQGAGSHRAGVRRQRPPLPLHPPVPKCG